MEATMKSVSGLSYEDTIFYEEDGNKNKMVVHIRMNDECKNKICEFDITADIYELHRSRWVWQAGGCCHEDILKRAPQYKRFVDLHLCNHYGYGVMNGIHVALYWFKLKEFDKVSSSLRLKDGELDKILLHMEDELSLKFGLHKMGIFDRWHQEALEAIEVLNKLTGCRWVNPYSEDEERFVMKSFTEEEIKLMEERFANGYYSKEQVEERREKSLNKKIDEQKAKVVEEYNKATSRQQEIMNIKTSILNEGILLDNVIVYEHCKEVRFNWKDYDMQVSREDFDRYVAKIKSCKLFEDWKFNFGKRKQS